MSETYLIKGSTVFSAADDLKQEEEKAIARNNFTFQREVAQGQQPRESRGSNTGNHDLVCCQFF